MAKLKPKSFNDIYDSDSIYNLEQAIDIVKKASSAKFDESVDLAINLNVDPRHAEQNITVSTSLPKGTGKKVRIAVLANDEQQNLAKEAGAEIAVEQAKCTERAGKFWGYVISRLQSHSCLPAAACTPMCKQFVRC